MAKLYPPLIEGTIPAFYGDSITIPFSMNKTVSIYNIAGFALKIKTIQNNIQLGVLKGKISEKNTLDIPLLQNFDGENNFISFSLSTDETLKGKLKIGQYYKIQLAYIDEIGEVGHYSTVGVIKYTSEPKISIDGLVKGERNQAQYTYIGCYEQEIDWTEKVYSYNFKIWDVNGNIVADTGELLHNTANDEKNKSTDTFIFTKELTNNSVYYIQYEVTTTGKMVVRQKYRISPKQSVLPELTAELRVSLNEEDGYVEATLQGEIVNGCEKTANGAFLVTRRKEDEPGNWEELVRFGLRGEKPSSWKWKDFTVEQGVNYIYSIQQYNDKGLYSQRILNKIKSEKEDDKWYEAPIYIDFEHAFLFDGERQLKIKYDPKVSSFKTTILESKVETLGSKHPFIFRNGHVSYKDFPIAGLISYLVDENNFFLDNNLNDYHRDSVITDVLDLKEREKINEKRKLSTKTNNLSGENIYKERGFKLAVLDWLNDGKPKLFRSPTEGNYIVRLMNVSLTPNDTLGRMIHSFNSNAYEIADCDYTNLSNYGFIRSSEKNSESKKVTQWASVETFDLIPSEEEANKETGYGNNILPKGVQATELKIEGMIPGDKIQITYVDGNKLDIVIGATGSYAAVNLAPIESVQLHKTNVKINGIITYSYETTYSNKFSLYNDATTVEVPAKQVFGADVQNINIRTYLEDLKNSILNVYYMAFEKRPIQIVYADVGKDIIVSNTEVDINISNLYFDRYKTEKLTVDKLEPYMIYQIRLNALDNTTDIEHNQDYYIDNNLDYFFPQPKDKAYIDGRNGKIFQGKEYSTRIYIDPKIDLKGDISKQLADLPGIDINETGFYRIDDIKPEQLFIGTGVILTIGYCTSLVTYNFETDDKYASKSARDDYDAALKAYQDAVKDGDTTGIQLADEAVKKSYNLLLGKIKEDLTNYKKENGLGEDE